MTRWSSHSTTFRPCFVHHVRGRYYSELIFDKSADGFDPDEIVRRARERIGSAGEPAAPQRRRR